MKSFCFVMLILVFTISAAQCQIVMATSDYTTGNTAMYDIKTGTFIDNTLPHHQDVYVKTDGVYCYILEGFGKNAIIKYNSSPIASSEKVIYHYSVSSDGSETNPKDIVFLDSKAYVILLGSSSILIIDPNTTSEKSFIKGKIDLSAWVDADGSPEACLGFVYDGMVYIVLQRQENWVPKTATLIKIDPSTDTIMDMDETVKGIQGIDLMVKNPQWGSLLGSKLYLAGTVYGKTEGAVITIDLTNPAHQVKIIDEAIAGITIAGMDVFSDDCALIYSSDENWNMVARFFDPADGSLGDYLPVPNAGGGAVMVDGLLYVGSREETNPGMYIVDPKTNSTVGSIFPTELPPLNIVYVGKEKSTLVSESTDMPGSFSVSAAYPNPFNPFTTVSFTLSRPNIVRVDVFNTAGQMVDTISNTYMDTGYQSVVWDASGRASGIYYLRVSDGVFSQTAKVTLVK